MQKAVALKDVMWILRPAIQILTFLAIEEYIKTKEDNKEIRQIYHV